VVDARVARRNQARNLLRDDVIFDTSVLLQVNRTLHKGVAECAQEQRPSIVMSHMKDHQLFWFRSPASVITILGDSMALFDVLQNANHQSN
jgi:hypothetical protein